MAKSENDDMSKMTTLLKPQDPHCCKNVFKGVVGGRKVRNYSKVVPNAGVKSDIL